MGVVVGLGALAALVSLERKRSTAYANARSALATLSGCGIVATAAIREGAHFPLHATASCLAFGAAVALLWVVAAGADAAARRRAGVLTAVCAATGGGQFAKLAGLVPFPSWLLGLGEAACVGLYGWAVYATA